MSKVIVQRVFAKESFAVDGAALTSGWMPGQAFKLNATGDGVILSNAGNAVFIGIDDSDELASPPSYPALHFVAL